MEHTQSHLSPQRSSRCSRSWSQCTSGSLADVFPADKAARIRQLQAQGHKVGMVGNGVNDAPALTQADVGFATDVAIDSAQVILMKSDPFDVAGAIELSRATLGKMHQNLCWAVGYNVIAFPLAAGVLYPFTLWPEIAALSMSGSSAIVAVSALMLKRTSWQESSWLKYRESRLNTFLPEAAPRHDMRFFHADDHCSA